MSVVQATFAATLVDEWVRAGVTDAVVCPGSRSTPLALALAARHELTVHVRLDERSAGFFALGLAMATGRPVAVCVTSGTAAAELHPAVIEAHHGRVPLLVCTADRPPELHGVGAPQTIDQIGLYGPALRWSASPGVPVEATAATWRSLAARAVVETSAGPAGPGPVHLDLAFRDPLVGEPGPLPPGRPDGRPFHHVQAPAASAPLRPWPGRAGVIVAGAGCGPPAAVLALAERLGWPVLADPRSGCRVDHPNVVAAADAIARAAGQQLVPEVVVRLGAGWASKVLPTLLAGAETIAVDPWWAWEDPDRTAAVVYRADPGAWIEEALAAPPPETPPGWLHRWASAERTAQAAIEAVLCDGPDDPLTEPGVARRLYPMIPDGATVVVSSSMPVRDLEWFAPRVPRPPRVLANRGANGIDGVSSTALGAAAAGGAPVVALIGDLAFLHDVSALVTSVSGPRAASCTLVVVDNGGGGIFEFLPQAGLVARERFEHLFGTPQVPDVVEVAAGFGAETADVGTHAELGAALGRLAGGSGLSVVRVRVPARPANVEVHQRIHAAVAAALSASPV